MKLSEALSKMDDTLSTIIIGIFIWSIFLGIFFCFGAWHDTRNYNEHHYVRCGYVTEVDYEHDLVTIEDSVGFLWQFEGCEDWAEGDFCGCLMYDNHSPKYILDDIIVNTSYQNY